MNILITGAAGFIGSNLSELLINEHNIIAVDNFDPFYARTIKEKNIEQLLKNESFIFYENNLLDSDFINHLFNTHKFDIIIHLASKAGVRPSVEEPADFLNNNINSTFNLLQAAKNENVKNFIFASSSSVYGNNKKIPFSEDDQVIQPISPYAVSKKTCELLCYNYFHLYNINTVCLRFFTVYGKRQRPDLAIAKFTDLIYNSQQLPFYGDGSSMRDYTYIDDICDGVVKCMNWLSEQSEPIYQIVNLGENQTISLKNLVTLIENELGKKANINYLPAQQGDLHTTYANIDKAKQLFGYEPNTNIEQGIKKYVEYYLMSLNR